MKASDDDGTAVSKVPISLALEEYLGRNMPAFEQVIARAMTLQVIYGLGTERAVREAMREVVA